MSRIEVPEIWVSRINDYKARTERMPVWCERNQVTQHQLYYWMDRLKKAKQQALSASKPQFIPLCFDNETVEADVSNQVHPDHQGAGASPLLIRIGPATVEVGPGFDALLFAEVVKALKSLC